MSRAVFTHSRAPPPHLIDSAVVTQDHTSVSHVKLHRRSLQEEKHTTPGHFNLDRLAEYCTVLCI